MKKSFDNLTHNILTFLEAQEAHELSPNLSRKLLLATAKANLVGDANTKGQIRIALHHTTWNGSRRETISKHMPKPWFIRRRNNVLDRFLEEAESLGADFSHRWTAEERDQIKTSGTFNNWSID